MTISSETNHVSYSGDGSISEFAFTFKIFEGGNLKVVVIDPNDVEYTLPYSIYAYTVAGELGKFESGGIVFLLYDNAGSMDPWFLPANWTVTISLNMDYTQPTNLIYGGSYFSDSIETMVDRVVKMIQQLAELVANGGGNGGGSPIGAWGDPIKVIISSGVLVLPGSGYYSVDTENGAATDDLIEITGLSVGDQVILKIENDARVVVAKNWSSLKLDTGVDFTMDSVYDRLMLQCAELNVCVELGSRTSGGN